MDKKEFTIEDIDYILSMECKSLKALWQNLDKRMWKNFIKYDIYRNHYYKWDYYTTTELSRISWINKFTLSSRINTSKMSVEDAMLTPVRIHNKYNFIT